MHRMGPSISFVICKNMSYSGLSYPSSPVPACVTGPVMQHCLSVLQRVGTIVTRSVVILCDDWSIGDRQVAITHHSIYAPSHATQWP